MKTQLGDPLTAKQQAVLDFLRSFRAAKGYMPTFREIKQHFGWRSLAACTYVLEVLQRKGYLTREEGTARSLVLLTGKTEAQMISLLRDAIRLCIARKCGNVVWYDVPDEDVDSYVLAAREARDRRKEAAHVQESSRQQEKD